MSEILYAKDKVYPYPTNTDELRACLADWEWRIFSGHLYKITTKGDDAPAEEPEVAVPFIPNEAQRDLARNCWHRNIILKARQLGFSTFIDILALDHALFNKDQEVVVIAHTKDAATKLYRKKVCFAYDNLPQFVRDLIPTVERSQTQMVFKNGSSIEVTSSARGGTPHFLHISEFGKVAAKMPDKALEITTGSLQGVPSNGRVFIESTAEGYAGAFFEMSGAAEKKKLQGKVLKQLDYRFHFYPWHGEPNYTVDPRGVAISAKDHEYFDTIENEMDVEITLGQRAWYVSKRESDFAATPEHMWREYPSTPRECWQASNEGRYLAQAMAKARSEHRIGHFPRIAHVPVNTFWDLGASDSTVIWLHQRIGPWDRWMGYREAQDASYLDDILWLEAQGFLIGDNFLPHDASNKSKGIESTTSPVYKLREMRPTWTWHVVPRINEKQHAIDALRLDFSTYQFDEEACKEGLAHLEAYSREWNTRLQAWADHPRHDEHSHAADAIMQKAQGYHLVTPAASAKVEGTSNRGGRPALRRRPNGFTA